MTVTLPPSRPGVEPDMADEHRHRKELARVSNLMLKGHTNTSIFVTLTAGAATTTVVDSRLSAQTCFALAPTTANAAAALATTYGVATNGQLVLHHTNNGLTDRSFTVGLTG